MKPVLTAKQVKQLLDAGQSVPEQALLTPSAKDLLRENRSPLPAGAATSGGPSASAPDPARPLAHLSRRAGRLPPGVPETPPEPIVPSFEFDWEPGGDPSSPEEIQRFFYSPALQALKEAMVHVGHKMWGRNMVDGNGGNITVRVGDNLVLCTPTLRSKGELVADDIALVDLDGKQKAGWRKRTSEANTHLAIMKVQPMAKSVIHGHPPYSTAFAVAGIEPPTCLCSEAEIFTGPIKLVGYETPGSPENAKAVAEIAGENPAVLLANHGVMTWGTDVEDAYWKLENMETACQTVWVASQLNGGKLQTIPHEKMQEIFEIRKSIGMSDPREGLRECELCQNNDFNPGTTVCEVPQDTPAPVSAENPEAEALVQQLTDEILNQLR